MRNAVIRVDRGRYVGASYVKGVAPQNDVDALDNLIRTETINRDEAAVYPADVAKAIVRNLSYSPNRATPGYVIEEV